MLFDHINEATINNKNILIPQIFLKLVAHVYIICGSKKSQWKLGKITEW